MLSPQVPPRARAGRMAALALLAAAAALSCGGAEDAPPGTPMQVTAAPGDGMVTVAWAAVSGADDYVVHWSTVPGVTPARALALPSGSTVVHHLGLVNGQPYHYVVSARNGAGESAPSAEVSATPEPSVYPLSVAKAGTGTGTVASAPEGIACGGACAASFDAGALVTLEASPDYLSTFAGWTGGGCGGTGGCAVTMDGARTVTATFSRLRHTLSIATVGPGAGTVVSSPAGILCGSTCAAAFDAESVVTLTPTPDALSTFAGWSGAGCAGTGPCAVTMDGARTVTASFARRSFGLTVTRTGTGGGAVTSSPAGLDCGATCTAAFPYGTRVTLAATPDATSTFTGWSGSGCGGAGPCTVTVDTARSVAATFTRITYGLSVSRTGGGAVVSSPAAIDCGATCSATWTALSGVTLTAAPDPGASFLGWSGAGCSGVGACAVTMDSAKSVMAVFAYTLGVSRTSGGNVTSSSGGLSCGTVCTAVYLPGTSVVLTAAPTAGATFTGWSGGGCAGTGPCTVAMDGSKTVAASFAFGLTVAQVAQGGSPLGTVTSSPAGISCGADCTEPYAPGTAVQLTAAVPAGRRVTWSGCDASSGSTCSVTLSAARTVTATYR